MTRSSVILSLLCLAGGSGLAAQTQATARLSFRIPAVLQLETVASGGTAEARPSFIEVRRAVVLRVDANCGWRLVPVGAAPATAGVEVRAGVAGGAGAAFQPLAGGVPIAAGGRGRTIEVVLDYRLPAGTRPPPVSYQLEPAHD